MHPLEVEHHKIVIDLQNGHLKPTKDRNKLSLVDQWILRLKKEKWNVRSGSPVYRARRRLLDLSIKLL